MSILAITVMAIGSAAAMPAAKNAVEYGSYFTIASAEFSANDVVMIPSYEFVIVCGDKMVAEAGYEVATFRPPAGSPTNLFNSENKLVFYQNDFGAKIASHLLPDIRRLRQASVAAGSSRYSS